MHLVEDIEIISDDGKFGLKNNLKGEIILEPEYNLIEKWEHSHSYYFVSKPNEDPEIPDLYVIIKNNKIGFADENGIVVEPAYDNLLDEKFMYQEKLHPIFVASKGNLYGYIDKYGKPLTDFIYKDVDFPLIGPIAHVLRQDGVDEFISLSSNKVLYSNVNHSIRNFSVTKSHVVLMFENRYKVIDKDGNVITEFLNNKNLNGAGVRYLNEKLLMNFDETDVKTNFYKIGLLDYSGNILTDMKYSEIKPIAGTSTVLCTNTLGSLDELVNEKGQVLKTKMNNCISWNGVDDEDKLIPPLYYWNEGEDNSNPETCIEVDNNLLK